MQARAQVAQVELQMQALRFEHARQLAWYAEHQELLKSSEELVRQQANTIVQLEQQLLLSPARP